MPRPNGIVHTDRFGAIDMGWRAIAPIEDRLPTGCADDTEYARERIGAGIAQLGQDFAADTTFAHDIGMDILDGIDFDKGCYVGQEVGQPHEASRHRPPPAGDRSWRRRACGLAGAGQWPR